MQPKLGHEIAAFWNARKNVGCEVIIFTTPPCKNANAMCTVFWRVHYQKAAKEFSKNITKNIAKMSMVGVSAILHKKSHGILMCRDFEFLPTCAARARHGRKTI